MNERLKEIMLQHGLHKHISEDCQSRMEMLYNVIVKECIDIVKPTEHHEVWAEDYVGGLEGLELLDNRVAKLKEYFGVE